MALRNWELNRSSKGFVEYIDTRSNTKFVVIKSTTIGLAKKRIWVVTLEGATKFRRLGDYDTKQKALNFAKRYMQSH